MLTRERKKRSPTGISIDYSIDKKGYLREYYRRNRERLLRDSKFRHREWLKTNRGRRLANIRAVTASRKQAAFELLGGVCARCRFSDARALQVDHIEQWGGTRAERIKQGESGEKLYRRLLIGSADKNKYQLLCANCNWIKRVENHEHKRKS